MQEAVSYPDIDPHSDAVSEVSRICQHIPCHVIWGGNGELVYATFIYIRGSWYLH
jgi:Rieske Fe-S protein